MYKLTILKMSCSGCINAIKSALLKLDAKATVSCDLVSKEVLVSTSASITDVTQALANAGYPSSNP